MGTSTTSEKIIRLNGARLSYPRLFKPEPFQAGGEPKFSAAFLFDPSDKAHAAIIADLKAEAKRLALDAYGGQVPEGLKLCFGAGDKLDKVPDGYAGMVYVRASNSIRPAVANRGGNPVAEGDAQVPYAGCYVNGTITLWAQNNKFGKRINANLRGVQFVRDGEAFGQAPVSADSEFEALDDNSPAPGVDAKAAAGDDWDL